MTEGIAKTVLLILLIAATAGVFWSDVYQDDARTQVQLVGQDIATLLFVVPLLGFGIWSIQHLFGKLLVLGTLGYTAYTYCIYTFGVHLNVLFFAYLALMVLAILGLISCMNSIEAADARAALRSRLPVIPVALFNILFALLLTLLWMTAILTSLDAGQPLAPPENLVFPLDLGFIVPGCLIGGVLYVRRHPMGLILSAMMLLKISTLGAAVSAMNVLLWVNHMKVDLGLAIFFAVITALSSLLYAWLLWRTAQVKV